jgi:hypothetical protein
VGFLDFGDHSLGDLCSGDCSGSCWFARHHVFTLAFALVLATPLAGSIFLGRNAEVVNFVIRSLSGETTVLWQRHHSPQLLLLFELGSFMFIKETGNEQVKKVIC